MIYIIVIVIISSYQYGICINIFNATFKRLLSLQHYTNLTFLKLYYGTCKCQLVIIINMALTVVQPCLSTSGAVIILKRRSLCNFSVHIIKSCCRRIESKGAATLNFFPDSSKVLFNTFSKNGKSATFLEMSSAATPLHPP